MNRVFQHIESAADNIVIAGLLIGLPTAFGAFFLSSL
jgi:hypothetical protein